MGVCEVCSWGHCMLNILKKQALANENLIAYFWYNIRDNNIVLV